MDLRSQRFAKERLFVLAGLALASALCLALEVFRERHFGSADYSFMRWNLFLAWIPMVLALVAYDRYRRGARILGLTPVLVLWLLFLPNAPYIVTDFIHLSSRSGAPLWFDGVMLSAFAWTGLLLGFVSLYLVHAVARHRFGGAIGWSGAFGALALVSVGIYLGRVKEWNSWDLLVRPGVRLAELQLRLADPSSLGKAIGATLGLTLLLTLAYLVFYVLMGARFEPQPVRRSTEQ